MKLLTCQILIVGAGPAGLAAAASAQAHGQVLVLDENPQRGGQIWRGGPKDRQSQQWFAQSEHISILHRSRVLGPLGPNRLLAESANEQIQIEFEKLILATGARERFLPFPGWTLPGVLGAGGLQSLAKQGLPITNKRIVVAGSGPLLLAVAAYLREHGAKVQAILEQASPQQLVPFGLALARKPSKLAQAAQFGRQLIGVPYLLNSYVIAAEGQKQLERITIQRGKRRHTLECDYLACGFGLIPNNELGLAFGCESQSNTLIVDEYQRTSQAHIYAAGEVCGIGGVDLALIQGQIAGLHASGQSQAAQALQAQQRAEQHFAQTLNQAFTLRPELRALAQPDTIVCRCEDQNYASLRQHQSWRSAKLQTRCGMGPCQGRICGGATEFLFGWTQDSVRTPIHAARIDTLICQAASPQSELELNGEHS